MYHGRCRYVAASMGSMAAEDTMCSFALQTTTAVAVVVASSSAITHTASPACPWPCRCIWIADIHITAISSYLALATEVGARMARFLLTNPSTAVARLVHTAFLRPLALAARDGTPRRMRQQAE